MEIKGAAREAQTRDTYPASMEIGAEFNGVCLSHYRTEGHEQTKGRRRAKGTTTLASSVTNRRQVRCLLASATSFLLSEQLNELGQEIFIGGRKWKIKTICKKRNSDKLLPGLFCSLAPCVRHVPESDASKLGYQRPWELLERF